MEETDLWIEPHSLSSRDAIVEQQGIEERQQRVDPADRRAPYAPAEPKLLAVGADKPAEHLEVGARRLAFEAADLLRVVAVFQPPQNVRQAVGSLAECHAVRLVARFPRAAQEQLAAVLELAGNDVAADRSGLLWIRESFMLGAAQQDVAAGRPNHPGGEAP